MLTPRHAREMAVVFVAQAGSAFAALAAVKLLPVLLLPDEYGYTAIVTSYVVAIVTVLAAPGTGAGQIIFHDAVHQGRARRLLGTLLVPARAPGPREPLSRAPGRGPRPAPPLGTPPAPPPPPASPRALLTPPPRHIE